MEKSPLIFDIRHFTLDDGPGIRTTVFLKGCPLNCAWCHNPEGIDPEKQLVFDPERCIHCDTCASVCPQNAIATGSAGRINDELCDCCGICAEECPSNALRVIGQDYTPDELTKILLEDREFYSVSDGGVTFSGGEPALFMDYLSVVFKKLKKHHIHIAIQTSGYFEYRSFKEKLLPFLDLIYFDMKLTSENEFRRWTGGNADLPLKNIELLCRDRCAAVIASIPLVPGITTTKENLISIKDFLAKAGCRDVVFRPYHPGGIAKRAVLGKTLPNNLLDKPLSINGERKARAFFMESR
jgi:pyruvate formate lyase activating enzyme